MTNPPEQPQQPGPWQDPTWPTPEQQQPQQPYADPYGGVPTSAPGYGVPPGTPSGYPPAYPGYGYGPPQSARTNSLAITSLVLALCGLLCGATAPIGAIMGHVARRQIRERGESGDGMALAGIIIGWIITGLFVAFFALLIFGLIASANNNASATY
jgi:hypothetical protein